MIDVVKARWQQGNRTSPWPKQEPRLPERFRGRPAWEAARCKTDCRNCAAACPTEAVRLGQAGLSLDLGRCLFCADCAQACSAGALRFTRDYRLAATQREHLVISDSPTVMVQALEAKTRRLFGRSLKLRQVSAGGCNACEADVNVLNTVVFDLARFGLQFVASPRHADGLVITGPVTRNMELALKKTYEAVAFPKLVVAVGACAISGGPYLDHPEALNGAASVVPVDLFIPGCPPHPFTILDGLLRWLK